LSQRRVAVTGIGAISPTGATSAEFLAAARTATCGIGPIEAIPTDRLSIKIAAEVKGFDPVAHFERRRIAMLDRTSLLAVVAAREAMAQAGLSRAGAAFDSARAGVILGASIGLNTFDDAYRAFYGEGVNRVPPLSVPRIMPNAPASAVSMEFGLRGASFSTASACASSTHAIGLAFQMVRHGMLDVAVTGGSDAPITVGHMKAWEALRVLSPDGCRPFSKNRNGLVIGEGAAMLVLESFEHARARGAPILAEIAGFGMTADAADLTAPDEHGAAASMRAALEDAGIAADAVGYINAHGTATRINDRAEVGALRTVFGAHLSRMAVSSTKSMIGHCMAGGGALELALTALAMRAGVVPPTAGPTEPDPECDIDTVPNTARAVQVEWALSNSFAFGGLNAVIALRTAE
jgi:nodulation protein E